MNKRIDELLEKYWKAETSLAEERELRGLLAKSDQYKAEKEMFLGLRDWSMEEPNLRMPSKTIKMKSRKWIGWAASVAILIGTAWGYQAYERKQAEEQAFRDVMQAFAMIQTNFSKGQDQLKVMNEFRYLNTTTELFGENLKK